MLSATLWASSLNLPLPKGLFLAYAPLLVRFAPSPSRLLCLTDPLLPFGFMMRCLNGNFLFKVFPYFSVFFIIS